MVSEQVKVKVKLIKKIKNNKKGVISIEGNFGEVVVKNGDSNYLIDFSIDNEIIIRLIKNLVKLLFKR